MILRLLTMKTAQIDHFLEQLTRSQREYCLLKLKSAASLIRVVTTCPCCQHTNFIKEGTYKGLQKYQCKTTGKIFSAKTQTVFSGLYQLDKFQLLLELMAGRKLPTITEIQAQLQISRQTAFDWRTKVLTALYHEVNFNQQLVEFDETNFMLSRKGRKGLARSRERGKKLVGDNPYNVKVFMTYSRTTQKLELFTSHMGRTKTQDVANYLDSKSEIVVYSDRHRSYQRYFRERQVLNRVFRSGDHVSLTDRRVHNQTLNAYSRGLHNFLNEDLKGVSTKYLQGYLNWFMLRGNSMKLVDLVGANKVALAIFKQKEKEFNYFLQHNGRTNYGHCRDRYA